MSALANNSTPIPFHRNFTDAQILTLHITVITCSSITMVISLSFILYVFIQTYRKKLFLRYMSVRILTYIEVCGFLSSISDLYVLPYSNAHLPRSLCIIEGMQTQIVEIAGALWTLSLSVFIITTLVSNMKKKILMEVVFHSFIWPFALLCALLPLIGDTYHRKGGWCWISDSSTLGKVWQWVLSYSLAWIIASIITVLYITTIILIIREKRKKFHSAYLSQVHQTYMKLVAYPAVFLVSWMFPTIYRIYDQSTRSTGANITTLFALELIMRMSLRSQGTLNVIIFAIAPLGRQGSSKLVRKVVSLCFMNRDMEAEETLITNENDEYVGNDTACMVHEEENIATPYYAIRRGSLRINNMNDLQ